MIGQGKLIGGALIALGIAIAGVLALYGFANKDTLTGGSIALVSGCGILLGVILAGAGVFFLVTGQSETRSYAEVEKEKHVLNAVQTQGQVSIGNLAVEMNTTVEQIKKYVYDLVGKGLFTGYVDWKAGRLISQDATLLANKIRDTGKCPNCGAPLSLAGKGLVKCDYCGAEVFLAGAAPGPAPSAPSAPPAG
jgi:DNA-directed RNA polymerase subunit RPC12/RpoP